MADKTVTITSTSDSNTTYKAQATDSCGNKAAGTWTGTKCTGCAKFVTSTTNNYAVVTIYPADATAGTNDTYTITWSCADKVSTKYTIDVVTNIKKSLEKICPSLQINGRDWDLRLDVAAASDVDYLFDASNGYEHESGTSYDDISVTITIKKGNKVGQHRTSQFEFAVYAILVSTDPYEDDTYIYGDCDVEWGNV